MELIQTPPRQIVRFLSLSLTDSEVIADYGPNVAVVSVIIYFTQGWVPW